MGTGSHLWQWQSQRFSTTGTSLGCYELPLGGFNVWHKKLKDRSMFFALFNLKGKKSRFQNDVAFAFLGEIRQTDVSTIKLQCL